MLSRLSGKHIIFGSAFASIILSASGTFVNRFEILHYISIIIIITDFIVTQYSVPKVRRTVVTNQYSTSLILQAQACNLEGSNHMFPQVPVVILHSCYSSTEGDIFWTMPTDSDSSSHL
jgi:hypothetical protein